MRRVSTNGHVVVAVVTSVLAGAGPGSRAMWRQRPSGIIGIRNPKVWPLTAAADSSGLILGLARPLGAAC
jgi:hypothetical protein